VLTNQAVIPWANERTPYLLNPHIRGWEAGALPVFPSRFISMAE